jgi:hypothetical protein
MKKRSLLLFFSFLLVLGVQRVQADVATEGEMGIKVELVNPTNFPGFNFYIQYQTYHYDMGWQPGATSKVFLEAGKHVSTGDRYSSSLLYAEDKQGNVFVSKEEIGGSVIEKGKNVAYHLHRIKVLSVKDGEVQFQIKEKQKVDENGKVLKVMKSEVEMNWVVIMVPIVCLLGLVAFLVVRGKRNAVA